MTIDIAKLEELVLSNKLSPHNIHWHALDQFEQATEGKLSPATATSPWAALAAFSSVTTAAVNSEVDDAVRQISPEYATNIDELARYLPYKELTTIHATPVTTSFNLKLRMADLIAHAVVQSPTTKQLVIPRGSVYRYLDGYAFGCHHDILVTITNDDTVDARYLDNSNPLVELLNPIIEVSKEYIGTGSGGLGVHYVNIPINLHQFAVTTSSFPITQSQPFSQVFDLTDQYYHARVFNRVGGEWVEMHTSFSEFIYDPQDGNATAVIKLLENGQLSVEVPMIYITRGIVTSEVKIMLYTSKGALDLDLERAVMANFQVEFINTDPTQAALTAPLVSFSDVLMGSVTRIVGGSNIPSFETLRSRVVNNIQDKAPLTPAQLEAKLGAMGYTVPHLSNYVTENVYLGSKPLGHYDTGEVNVIYPGGTIQIYLGNLDDCHGVVKNGNNYTITPEAVFGYDNSKGSVLSKAQYAALDALSDSATVDLLNKQTHLFSPFYYCLEYQDNTSALYAYDLAEPQVMARDFVGVNQNAAGIISTESVTIAKTDTGYRVVITAACDSTYQELDDAAMVAQLSIVNSTGGLFSINPTAVARNEDSGFIFTFDFESDWDLDSDLGIRFNNLDSNTLGTAQILLDSTLKLGYNLVANLPPTNDSVYKDYSDPSKLPAGYQTVTAETLTLRFGRRLDELYRPVRTLQGQAIYQTYETDVYGYYEEDEPKLDDAGFVVFSENPDYVEGGSEPFYIYEMEHREGDPILNEDGSHKVIHRAGTFVIDPATKQPAIVGYRTSYTETSLVLLDYKFALANANVDAIRRQMVTDITTDIAPLNQEMLELSELYYSISSSCGVALVDYDADRSGTISNELTFKLTVTLAKTDYADAKFRETLTRTIKRTIASNLETRTLALNKLIKAIDAEIGESVIGFTIDSVGGDEDLVSMTLVNPEDVLGVKGKLELNSSGQMVIGDGITIEYKVAKGA